VLKAISKLKLKNRKKIIFSILVVYLPAYSYIHSKKPVKQAAL